MSWRFRIRLLEVKYMEPWWLGNFILGLWYGFPLCCVLAFCAARRYGLCHPGRVWREKSPKTYATWVGDHVPCVKCREGR